MNRTTRTFTSLLPGLLPLLLASAPAWAATGDQLITNLPPPPGAAPPPAPTVQYPFASVKASEFTRSSHLGRRFRTAFRAEQGPGAAYRSVVQYRVRFKLDPTSDGLSPPGEDMLLSAAPNPNAPQAGQTPLFQIAIPNGCFVDLTQHHRHFDVDGLGCGVQVRLHDPNTMMDTSLNDYVHHFRVRLSMRHNNVQGELRVRINFVGFNARAGVNADGVLNLNLGNDGVTGLPMKAPHRGHGPSRGSL